MNLEQLSVMIMAAGGLGTASFGIVEALKWSRVGEFGYKKIPQTLGPLMDALKSAYGNDYDKLLRAQYRKDRKEQKILTRTLRQGIRVGLNKNNVKMIAEFLGHSDTESLLAAVETLGKIAQSEDFDFPEKQRNALGRFELAVDARIDAAVTLAYDSYVGSIRLLASLVSLVIAMLAAFLLDVSYIKAVIVGIMAVPIAPMANDIVGALQSAAKALQKKA